MPEPADFSDPRSKLIENLLSRQDDVIEQLEKLDQRLISTIEKIHPPKMEEVEGEAAAKKAA